MTVLQWNEAFVLNNARMDQTHVEFVDLLNELGEVSDDALAAGLERLLTHTQAHFDQEDRWMKRTNFAPVNCHTTEHANVMEVIGEVLRRVTGGDVEIGRRLVQELGPWFANHAETMDAALAFHMSAVGFDTANETFATPPTDEGREMLAATPLSSCGTACGDHSAHQ